MTPATTAPDTRARVLAAARALFTTQGYAATSMRQIAAAAQLALGGLYNYFPSKETLFEALLEQSELNPAPERGAAHVFEGLVQQPDLGPLLLIELLEFQGRHLSARMSGLTASPAQRLGLSLAVAYHLTDRLGDTHSAAVESGTWSPEAFAQAVIHGLSHSE